MAKISYVEMRELNVVAVWTHDWYLWFTYNAHVHVSWMAKISHVEMRELNVVAVWRSVLSDIFHF